VLKPEMQVLDEIVQMLTEDRFRGKMVVILAGYEEQVTCIVFALYSSSDQNI
jgi:predicted secreted protein